MSKILRSDAVDALARKGLRFLRGVKAEPATALKCLRPIRMFVRGAVMSIHYGAAINVPMPGGNSLMVVKAA